jgi:hypothetical protein
MRRFAANPSSSPKTTLMNARVTAASLFRVLGVTPARGADHQNLIETPDLTVTLSKPSDDLCRDLDQSRAIATILLMGRGRTLGDNEAASVAAEMSKLRTRRSPDDVLLFVETRSDEVITVSGSVRDIAGWQVGFDLYDQEALYERHVEILNRVVASLAMQCSRNIETALILRGTYARTATNERIVSYQFTANPPRISVANPLSPTVDIAGVLDRLKVRDDLDRIVRMFVMSGQNEDPFSIWRSAWTGLELFVERRFRYYEARFYDSLLVGRPYVASFFGHVRKKNPPLLEKFRVIALVLSPGTAHDDIALFAQVKKSRDNMIHTGEDPADLETAEKIRDLLKRYLYSDLPNPRA